MAKTNLSATIKRDSLPKCWVKKGEEYILTNKDGKPIRQNLPYVHLQFESVLQDLDIPYEITQSPDKNRPDRFYYICSFWNPELYEVEKLSLPVYRQVQSTKDTFVNTGEIYEGTAYTREMLRKAFETQKVVIPAVEARKAFIQAMEECQRAQNYMPAPTKVDEEFLKETLGDKTATVVKIANAEISSEVNNGDIKIVPAYYSDGNKNGYYGIFDMAKLKYVPVIKLVLPEEVARKVCGARNHNQHYWEYLFGKGIKIISAKE